MEPKSRRYIFYSYNFCDKVDNDHKEAVRMDFDMVPAMPDFRDEEAEADTVWMDPYGQAVGQNSFQDWQVSIFTFFNSKFMIIVSGSYVRGI